MANELVHLLAAEDSVHIPRIGSMRYDADNHSVTFTPSDELLHNIEVHIKGA